MTKCSVIGCDHDATREIVVARVTFPTTSLDFGTPVCEWHDADYRAGVASIGSIVEFLPFDITVSLDDLIVRGETADAAASARATEPRQQ